MQKHAPDAYLAPNFRKRFPTTVLGKNKLQKWLFFCFNRDGHVNSFNGLIISKIESWILVSAFLLCLTAKSL